MMKQSLNPRKPYSSVIHLSLGNREAGGRDAG